MTPSTSHTENTRRIAKNSGFLFFRMLLVMGVGLYTSRVVLDVLGVDDYGIYNIVGTIVAFLVFFKMALTNATYRFLTYELGAGNTEKLKSTFSMSVNTHMILAATFLIILELIGPWLISNKLNIPVDRIAAAHWVFQFSLLTFCTDVIRTPYNACVIAHEKMDFFAITGIVEVCLKLIIVFALIAIPFDKLITYAILILAITVIIFLWYYNFCHKNFIETKYTLSWDSNLAKKLLSYSGWSIIVNAADMLTLQSLNIFLNIFGNVVINASFAIAQQVNSKVGGFLQSFTQAFNPQIIKSYASGDTLYFMKLIFSTSKLSFLLLFSITFPLGVYANYILDIWLVEVPAYASTFLRIIFCYALLDCLQAPLWVAVHATGKLKTHQIMIASIKVCVIPLSYFALKLDMPYWTEIAIWAGMNGVASIARTLYMRHLIKLSASKFFIEAYLRSACVVAISTPLPLYYAFNTEANIISLAMFLAMFLAIYATCAWFLGLNTMERSFITKAVKDKINKK